MFISFLQELFTRLATKSPKFFKIFQIISGALVMVTGLPGFFEQIGVNLPDYLMMFQNKLVAYAAVGSLFASLLTTQSKIVGKTDNGEPIKQTDEKKLPFTAQIEAREAEKKGM